jgi:hypothetical protein
MLQLTPQSRIFVATEPVDFRTGIDGLAAVCRQVLGDNPLEGAVYLTFRTPSDGDPSIFPGGIFSAHSKTQQWYVVVS